MSDDLILKYSIGLGIAVVFLMCATGVMVRLRKQKNLRQKVILHVLQAIFLFGFIWTCKQYAKSAVTDFHWSEPITRLISLVTATAFMLVLLRQVFLLINLAGDYQQKKGLDPTSVHAFARVLKIVATVILFLLFGEHFGLSLSGLLTFGGIGGIAIGLASKDILSNFFSGIMLYYDRQFNIGDWISSPDRKIEGTVQEIGWRLTKIKTFDNRPLYVPNSLFSSISVENPGRMTNRRIDTSLGLRYEDAGKIRDIITDIRAMIQKNNDLDHTQTTLIYFNEFADSSLNIMVYCFTKTKVWAEWLAIQQEVYLQMIDIVHAHGADFAFPSQTIYMEADSGSSPAVASDLTPPDVPSTAVTSTPV